jgi:hypothetical protein
MLVELIIVISFFVLLDWAAFWKVGNWSRQFSGDINFTYSETIFPRVILTIIGGAALVFAKRHEEYSIILFILAFALAGSSHAYLYFKAFNHRKENKD